MNIPVFGPHGGPVERTVSRRVALQMLKRGEAVRVLDDRRREIGLRRKRLMPQFWTERSAGFVMNGASVNRLSGAICAA